MLGQLAHLDQVVQLDIPDLLEYQGPVGQREFKASGDSLGMWVAKEDWVIRAVLDWVTADPGDLLAPAAAQVTQDRLVLDTWVRRAYQVLRGDIQVVWAPRAREASRETQVVIQGHMVIRVILVVLDLWALPDPLDILDRKDPGALRDLSDSGVILAAVGSLFVVILAACKWDILVRPQVVVAEVWVLAAEHPLV
jgi:hypothetical protein